MKDVSQKSKFTNFCHLQHLRMWGLIEEILMERALGHLKYQNLNSLQEKGRTLRGWREVVDTWEVSVETWENQLTLSVGEGVVCIGWS
jgi:hypothetical protein